MFGAVKDILESYMRETECPYFEIDRTVNKNE